MLRSVDWIAAQKAVVEGTVYLDMPEMGVQGHALVTAIEPCPEIPEGEGRLVTGTFRHSRGIVYDLWVEGEEEPLGVTGSHPFWSVDRQGWIRAKDLKEGERLQGLGGTTPRVVGLKLREEPDGVFNLEVDGDHVYRVGTQGLLVHNASAVWTGPTHKDCTQRIGHCPQLDGSTGFSATPMFTTMTSTTHYGVILDVEGPTGVEVMRYYELPTGFRAIISSTGGGSEADRRILPPGWDRTANVGRSAIIYRGHLLARDLGGPGGVNDGGRRNLVTQSRGTNLRVMRAVERGVTDLVTQGRRVYYQIVAEYSGGATPRTLKIRACAQVGKEEYDSTVITHWEFGITL